jgi:hypothetical protein
LLRTELIERENSDAPDHLFAFAPALIAIGFGVWAASPANAPVSPSTVQGIEPFQMMVNAKELPTVEFADYTFVFPH